MENTTAVCSMSDVLPPSLLPTVKLNSFIACGTKQLFAFLDSPLACLPFSLPLARSLSLSLSLSVHLCLSLSVYFSLYYIFFLYFLFTPARGEKEMYPDIYQVKADEWSLRSLESSGSAPGLFLQRGFSYIFIYFYI